MLGLESSPLREDKEPEFGGVACPAAGGAGAFFFLCSDWTRASQGGSLGLWVPLDKLDIEIQTRMEGSHRGRQPDTFNRRADMADAASQTDEMQQNKQICSRGVTFRETEIAREASEEWGASGSHLESHYQKKVKSCFLLYLLINCNVKSTDHLLGAANEPGGQAEEEEWVRKPGGVLVLAGSFLGDGQQV